jgi:hypothetical protein
MASDISGTAFSSTGTLGAYYSVEQGDRVLPGEPQGLHDLQQQFQYLHLLLHHRVSNRAVQNSYPSWKKVIGFLITSLMMVVVKKVITSS